MSADIAVITESADAIADHSGYHWQGTWLTQRDRNGNAVYQGSFGVAADGHKTPPDRTLMCWATWIAFLNAPEGASIMWDNYGEAGPMNEDGTSRASIWVAYPDGTTEPVPEYAQRIAGLTGQQAGALFFSAEDDEIAAYAAALKANPDADLAELRDASEDAFTERMERGEYDPDHRNDYDA